MDQQISASLAEIPGFPMAATKPSAAHSRRCSVCHHPDRIWIELKFIEWNSPTRIAKEYGLYDRDSIYHHAHATGLFEQRRRNILCVYESILEKLAQTRITSSGILHAIDRVERAVRSHLPNPAAEIETTVTRDAALVLGPKSASKEADYGDQQSPGEAEQREGRAEDQSADRGEHDESPRSGEPGPECVPECSDSDLQERQYTPTDVPDSKEQDSPESRQSFENDAFDAETSTPITFALLPRHRAFLARRAGFENLRPHD
jgi:hypothetical protein